MLKPLYYIPEAEPEPFNYRDGSGEKLYCFGIDEAQCLNIEPDRKRFLDRLISGGKAAEHKAALALSVGNYLFAQKREILDRDEIAALAIEIQAEGLWQRLKPGNRLYLRYLFEDGKSVTQLFRPYA